MKVWQWSIQQVIRQRFKPHILPFNRPKSQTTISCLRNRKFNSLYENFTRSYVKEKLEPKHVYICFGNSNSIRHLLEASNFPIDVASRWLIVIIFCRCCEIRYAMFLLRICPTHVLTIDGCCGRRLIWTERVSLSACNYYISEKSRKRK